MIAGRHTYQNIRIVVYHTLITAQASRNGILRLLPLNMTAPASSSILCSKAVFHQEVAAERGCDSILAAFDFARRSDSTSYGRLDAKILPVKSAADGIL